ncbi:MAG: nitrous oxide-stimulated promoter family protein [Planctomycetota bacterium]|jgi:hypothetical protein
MGSDKRLVREKKTIAVMIQIYCDGHHGGEKGKLCADCAGLLDYARQRLDKCPFGPDKGPCSKCHIHCYKPEMRQRVREVMRYAGPRMLKKHPILALDHLVKEKLPSKKKK